MPRNQILAALSTAEHDRLAPMLTPVRLGLRDVQIDVDVPIERIYFLETAVASMVSVMPDGSAVETATIGNEGLVGLPVFLGADRTPTQTFCQVAGTALVMRADDFRRELDGSPELRRVVGRYAQALFTLVAQSSACNRLHVIRQRCARWLLQTQDRVGADEFKLTQLFLAQMLGVRRASVNSAAAELAGEGLISYEYGTVRVLDRPGLERAACDCYQIIRRDFARLLEGRSMPNPLHDVQVTIDGKTVAREPDGAQGTAGDDGQEIVR